MGRVVVLGASTTDMNMRLPRLPKPGQTLLGDFFTGPGGKGANQAVAARRAGAEVVFLTAFGDDAFARAIRRHDEEEGIDLTFAKTVPGASSGVALIFVAEDGENLIGIAMGANAQLRPEDIDALPDERLRPARRPAREPGGADRDGRPRRRAGPCERDDGRRESGPGRPSARRAGGLVEDRRPDAERERGRGPHRPPPRRPRRRGRRLAGRGGEGRRDHAGRRGLPRRR